ncbi:hypothetical protein ACIRO1_34105 [Streptomyces sp. NPDC102381]
MNHSDDAATVHVTGHELLRDAPVAGAHLLPAREVAVIRET